MSRFAKALNKLQQQKQALPQDQPQVADGNHRSKDVSVRVLAVIMVALAILVLYHLCAAVSGVVAARNQIIDLNAVIETQQKEISALSQKLDKSGADERQDFKKVSAAVTGLDRRVDGLKTDSQKLERTSISLEHIKTVLYELRTGYQDLTAQITQLGKKVDNASAAAAPAADTGGK